MVDNRKPREKDTRETLERKQQWKPAQLLPLPDPRPGMDFRWVRSAMLGKADNVNVSAKFREGWEPVPASEFPELKVVSDHDTRFPENIEVGGLILCQCPSSLMHQRREYQTQKSAGQMEAVDRNYMREGDRRMPLLPSERQSRVSRFGDS